MKTLHLKSICYIAWTQIENPETLRTFWNNQNENKVIIRVGLSLMKYD